MAEPAANKWFADESVLGLGKLLARERDDVTYPGHPASDGIAPGALDTEWMPFVAARGWVVFHRDRRIAPVRQSWRYSGRRDYERCGSRARRISAPTTNSLCSSVTGNASNAKCNASARAPGR